jgi:hypothetical protein
MLKFSKKLVIALTLLNVVCSKLKITNVYNKHFFLSERRQQLTCPSLDGHKFYNIHNVHIQFDERLFAFHDLLNGYFAVKIVTSQCNVTTLLTREQIIQIFDTLSKTGGLNFYGNTLITAKNSLWKNLKDMRTVDESRLKLNEFLDSFNGIKSAASVVKEKLSNDPSGSSKDLALAVANLIIQVRRLHWKITSGYNKNIEVTYLESQLLSFRDVKHILIKLRYTLYFENDTDTSFDDVSRNIINHLETDYHRLVAEAIMTSKKYI